MKSKLSENKWQEPFSWCYHDAIFGVIIVNLKLSQIEIPSPKRSQLISDCGIIKYRVNENKTGENEQ